jgi:hypothetical protein
VKIPSVDKIDELEPTLVPATFAAMSSSDAYDVQTVEEPTVDERTYRSVASEEAARQAAKRAAPVMAKCEMVMMWTAFEGKGKRGRDQPSPIPGWFQRNQDKAGRLFRSRGDLGSGAAWRLDLGLVDNVVAFLVGGLAPPGSGITLTSAPWLWRPWTATKNR